MWPFFVDVGDLCRLKLKPIEAYRYDAITVIVVLLALGLLRAVGMVPVMGSGKYAIVFSILLSVIQWLTLSQTMKWFFYFNKLPKLRLSHFVLLSEALVLPSVLFLWFSNEVIGFTSLMFSVFAFWIQCLSLMRLSQLPLYKILLGYLCYLPVMAVMMMVLLAIFAAFGWLDLQEIIKTMEALQQQQ